MIVYLPSFALSVILSCTTMSIYGRILPLQMLVPILIFCMISFAALIYTDRHRLAGSLTITIFIVFVLFLIRILSVAGMQLNNVFFWQWVLTSGDESGFNIYYVLALSLGASLFFSITVYYFGVVLYRISFLTLISLMPCVLYAKVIVDIDNFWLILIAGSNLLLHISRSRNKTIYDNRNLNPIKPGLRINKKSCSAIFSALVFSLSILFICALIPKQEDAKYYDRFEDLFLGGDTTSELSQDFSNLSEYSGNADNFSSLGNRRIYTLYGDGYAYLKRQNFDHYDFENDRWFYDKNAMDMVYTADSWKNRYKNLQLNLLQDAIKTVCNKDPAFIKKYNLENFVNSQPVNDPEKNLFIRSENFGAVYYLASSRTIEILPSSAGLGHGITESGIFIRKDGPHSRDFSYRLKFYDQSSAVNSWVTTGITDLSYDKSLDMLTDMADFYADKTSDENKRRASVVDAFRSEQIYALNYKNITDSDTKNISAKIKNLAKEITSGAANDYYKAAAIAAYFHNGEFTYDVDYIPEDPGVDYFLFTSKRGSCSDFATAFVLLARSAGLCVRYAEGFLPEITTRENYYTISERDSHAFPEVFIPNTGWIVYEPTIGGTASQFDANTTGLWEFLTTLRIDYGLAFFAALFITVAFFIFILIKLLIPGVEELLFRIILNFMSTRNIILKSYNRIRKKNKSPSLTPLELNAFLKSKGRGIPIISSSYEELIYGEKEPDNTSEFKRVIISEYLKTGFY